MKDQVAVIRLRMHREGTTTHHTLTVELGKHRASPTVEFDTRGGALAYAADVVGDLLAEQEAHTSETWRELPAIELESP